MAKTTKPATPAKKTDLADPKSTALALYPKPNTNLPTFMAEDGAKGAEEIDKYIRPPWVKVIQPSSDSQTYPWTVGSVCLSPQKLLVAEMDTKEEGEVFHFVPLLFYPEWCCWNPIETKGTLPAIRAQSFDPKSQVAIAARTPELRRQPCPESDDNFITYAEHLNYLVLILDGPLPGVPAIISWSKAGHVNGTNFNALYRMRNAPLFGCVFEARSQYFKNPKGQWFDLVVSNPSEDCGVPPFIQDEGQYRQLREQHEMLSEARKAGLIVADREAVEPTPGSVPDDANSDY